MEAAVSAVSSSGGDRQETLASLRALKRRASDLASTHLEALDHFYLSRDVGSITRLTDGPVAVGGFASVVPPADQPRDGTGRASLASTAACVRSLLLSPAVKPGHADFAGLLKNVVERYESGQLSTFGLAHLNPFTMGQLLPVLRDVVGAAPEPAIETLVDDASARLEQELDNRGVAMPAKADPDAVEQRFLPHGYLTYGAMRALAAWDRRDSLLSAPSMQWSEMELYRQIALFHSGLDERSDAYQLGYNLLIQYRFNRFRLGDSLIESGLRTLFEAQLERGVWEKRDPIFRYATHGEAHCFSFELLSSLLRDLRGEWGLLVPWEGHLSRAVEWAARNAVRRYGPPMWRSAHLVEDTTPQSWATAEVYSFLQLYTSYLSWRMETIVREGFRGETAQTPNPRAFDDLYQADIRHPQDGPVLLGDLLRDRLLEPLRIPGEPPSYSLARSTNPRGKARSAILFGPPGTGKTTYVRKVAEYLGWPLVVLDPSDFAQEGLPLIATVATRVFSDLLELEDTVILFDEMEPLMHSRTDAGGSFEQKFLTTSLLPKLQELADRATCMFFVATNHLETVDPAVQRPGRFDFRLQIMPPSYDEKLRMARDCLGPELFAMAEADLRRHPYRTNLRLASRNEMLSLCEAIKRHPDRMEEVLSQFRAELIDDERFGDEAGAELRT
jgi:ATPase family protein associated with various cellular activities (AAA)